MIIQSELVAGEIYSFEYDKGRSIALVKVIQWDGNDVEIENIGDDNFFEAEKAIDSSMFVSETGTLFSEKIERCNGRIYIPLNLFMDVFSTHSGGDITKNSYFLKTAKIDFESYNKQNPEIYKQFKKFAFEAIQKGFRNYSANGIFEAIRWHTKTAGNDTFKVNNIYRADYARLFQKDFPQYNGFFRTRKLTAKRS